MNRTKLCRHRVPRHVAARSYWGDDYIYYKLYAMETRPLAPFVQRKPC